MAKKFSAKVGEAVAVTWIDSGAKHERSGVKPSEATLATITTTGIVLHIDNEKICVGSSVDTWGDGSYDIEEFIVIWRPAIQSGSKLVAVKKRGQKR